MNGLGEARCRWIKLCAPGGTGSCSIRIAFFFASGWSCEPGHYHEPCRVARQPQPLDMVDLSFLEQLAWLAGAKEICPSPKSKLCSIKTTRTTSSHHSSHLLNGTPSRLGPSRLYDTPVSNVVTFPFRLSSEMGQDARRTRLWCSGACRLCGKRLTGGHFGCDP